MQIALNFTFWYFGRRYGNISGYSIAGKVATVDVYMPASFSGFRHAGHTQWGARSKHPTGALVPFRPEMATRFTLYFKDEGGGGVAAAALRTLAPHCEAKVAPGPAPPAFDPNGLDEVGTNIVRAGGGDEALIYADVDEARRRVMIILDRAVRFLRGEASMWALCGCCLRWLVLMPWGPNKGLWHRKCRTIALARALYNIRATARALFNSPCSQPPADRLPAASFCW